MSIKLYYFDGRGLAEPIRLILSHAGVEFEDIRVPLDKLPAILPPEIKAKCTWGQVPIAEFEGKKLCQSLAITRYFARKYNLIPEDIYEAAQCDEYVDSIREFMTAWFATVHQQDPEKKAAKKQELLGTTKPRYFDVFESIVNGNGGKHLVGNSVSWADIYLAHGINHVETVNEINLLNDYPSLQSLSANVFSSSGIKAWMEKRPKTKF